MRQDAVAWLALFVALGGTGAYAANSIGTGDIIDNQVTSADVRDDSLGFGGLSAADLGPSSVRSSEVQDSSLNGGDIANDSLSGDDVYEPGLNMPPTTVTTFASGGGALSDTDGVFTKIASKDLTGFAATYSVVASAEVTTISPFGGDITRDASCELRSRAGSSAARRSA